MLDALPTIQWQRKYNGGKHSEFYLNSPDRFQLIRQQNWLSPTISTLALRRPCVSFTGSALALHSLFYLLRQPSRLFRQFPDSSDFLREGNFYFCVGPSGCVRLAWAQIGPTSVLLAVALPPLVSLRLSVQYSQTIPAPPLQNDQSICILSFLAPEIKLQINSFSLCVFLNEPQASLYVSYWDFNSWD